jgi:hypothetical protein
MLLLYALVAFVGKEAPRHSKNTAFIIAAILAPRLVTYRDMLLLTSLFLYFYCQREHRPLAKLFIKLGLGIAVALNLFWSFDRGIAGVVSIGLACLIMACRKRSYFIPMIGFLLTITALYCRTGFIGLQSYVENIKFLINTSSQWSYGWSLSSIAYSSALLLFSLSALIILVNSVSNKSHYSGERMANAVLLGTLIFIFFKIGSNRADLMHIYWGMWPAALAFLYANPGVENSVVSVPERRFFMNRLIGAANLASIAIFVGLFIPLSFSVKDSRQLIRMLRSPPKNEELVSEGIKWVVRELKSAGANCVFDLANHGVINGLSGLPACTRFLYPVYATRKHEDEIIETLRNNNPPVIVYSSTEWSFSLDNKNMHERFPALKSYLDKAYPYESCNYGYCLRYSERPRPR